MEKLLVIDYGSQYTHLITSRFRYLGVYTEIIPAQDDLKEKDLDKLKGEIKSGILKGIILSGGPNSVYDEDTLTLPKDFFDLDIPILAICYGHQLTHFVNGGKVKGGDTQEYGKSKLKIDKVFRLFSGINQEEITVWMSHGDSVVDMAKDFKNIGRTLDCEFAASAHDKKNIFTLQFHPEVSHTQYGIKILENFSDICLVKKEWSMEKFLEFELEDLKNKIADKNVFLFISGGVDSTVAYFLLNKAIGAERIYPVFVDTGFMRKDESKRVESLLNKAGVKNLQIIDAKKDFLEDLKGVVEPEIKRNIIGNKFIEIQSKIISKLGINTKNWLLAQGTIYPDTIESGGTKNSKTIKTHHNRVPEIQLMIEKGLIIEPLEKLYKDEVRKIGILLGISDELIYRHPFPGPGLSLRILCNDNYVDIFKTDSGDNLNYELEKKNIQKLVGDKFRVNILPVKSVGVQGDNRSYKHPVSLSILDKNIDWEELNNISTNITNNFNLVNRVLLNLGDNGDKLKLQKGFLTNDRIELLQEIDYIVEKFLNDKGYMRKIWQFPVVLIPLGNGDKESIVLRPIDSIEAMTASFSKIVITDLDYLVKKILQNKKIETVFYDLTGKPPGTIEWE